MKILPKFIVRVHARYSHSPHVEDLAAFARWLIDHGYHLGYAQSLVFRTMRSLEGSGLPPGRTWTAEELDQAFYRISHRRWYQAARHTFGVFLQSVGRLAPCRDNRPHASVCTTYQRFLSEVRGLAPQTVRQHLGEVSALLQRALPEGQSLRQLNAERIEQHIEQRGRQVGRRSLRASVTCLRAFLRYGFEQRLISTRLDAIDRPACFREELPPRALDWSLIQRFLHSIDRTDRCGWRDFMILHLMAHYGLRTGEITRLTLDAIDWKARTLRVERFKTQSWLVLPLLDQTLVLLRRYLQKERRPSQRGELFLRMIAPSRPLTTPGVCQIFKFRARRSGLPIAHASPYALRHSFAMRLFARGVGIKAIGDLLGHHSLVSTTIYLRLQTDVLRGVALPVPNQAKLQGGAA